MSSVSLNHLLAQARTADIARAAERAALFEPDARAGRRPRWATFIHRSGQAIRPASGPAAAGSDRSPVPCCA
jgi:hypothetical protein